jgi:hypothetical protein
MARKKKTKSSLAENIASQPAAPPPPLFLGEKERNLVKQINDEIIERVIGQTLVYYPISREHTNYHPIYGEAVQKTFLSPIRVQALVDWEGSKTETKTFGIDRVTSITTKFHRRRLTEDQDLYVREGDFLLYGDTFYEIVTIAEPKLLFGQIDFKFEVVAKCIKARESLFNAK